MSELPPVQPDSPYYEGGDVAPDNVVPFPGSLEDLAARLAAAEEKAAAAQDQTLRAVAEQENIRRRTAREVEHARLFPRVALVVVSGIVVVRESLLAPHGGRMAVFDPWRIEECQLSATQYRCSVPAAT